MPCKAQQQFSVDMDAELLGYVGKLINFIEGGQDANVQIFYQRLKREGQRLNINFYWIDEQMHLESYESKAISHCRFLNVLLPKALPPYPAEIQTAVHNSIKEYLNVNKQQWKDKNQEERDDYRKVLEQTVKKEFNLKPSDEYSYKQLVDKSRHQIINFMKKEPLKTQSEQKQLQKVVQRAQENDHSQNVSNSNDFEQQSINDYETIDNQVILCFEEI
ncbi:Hypothetical_protein [Hexamita inflata]|uniref:Hypothetical_protein n=1 Tax=Hexamita inflata TaxID=28002 RepID=A0AA86PVD1_9EUKA|nr:Hypothetical protein HINF_LOCUS31928 [Hexamita inflata]CAI9963609.1 Hypothetical protein HINF_LOCUS51254 [Hexamita inflata]